MKRSLGADVVFGEERTRVNRGIKKGKSPRPPLKTVRDIHKLRKDDFGHFIRTYHHVRTKKN